MNAIEIREQEIRALIKAHQFSNFTGVGKLSAEQFRALRSELHEILHGLEDAASTLAKRTISTNEHPSDEELDAIAEKYGVDYDEVHGTYMDFLCQMDGEMQEYAMGHYN